MTDPDETANTVGEIIEAWREHLAEEGAERPVTYQQAMGLGLRAQTERYEALTDRNLMSRSIAKRRAQGEYDASKHPDPAEYPR
jgi:hypothetical protein